MIEHPQNPSCIRFLFSSNFKDCLCWCIASLLMMLSNTLQLSNKMESVVKTRGGEADKICSCSTNLNTKASPRALFVCTQDVNDISNAIALPQTPSFFNRSTDYKKVSQAHSGPCNFLLDQYFDLS